MKLFGDHYAIGVVPFSRFNQHPRPAIGFIPVVTWMRAILDCGSLAGTALQFTPLSLRPITTILNASICSRRYLWDVIFALPTYFSSCLSNAKTPDYVQGLNLLPVTNTKHLPGCIAHESMTENDDFIEVKILTDELGNYAHHLGRQPPYSSTHIDR